MKTRFNQYVILIGANVLMRTIKSLTIYKSIIEELRGICTSTYLTGFIWLLILDKPFFFVLYKHETIQSQCQ